MSMSHGLNLQLFPRDSLVFEDCFKVRVPMAESKPHLQKLSKHLRLSVAVHTPFTLLTTGYRWESCQLFSVNHIVPICLHSGCLFVLFFSLWAPPVYWPHDVWVVDLVRFTAAALHFSYQAAISKNSPSFFFSSFRLPFNACECHTKWARCPLLTGRWGMGRDRAVACLDFLLFFVLVSV